MPLPADGSKWLPSPWDEAQSTYETNEAWYLGDVDRLQKLYTGNQAQRATHVHDGVPMAGGIVGAMTRFFWGRPAPAEQTRTRLHIPAPADLAVLSSDLLYAEPPEVRLAGKQTARPADAAAGSAQLQVANPVQDRLDLIVNSPMAHATLNTMGELQAAFGAAALVTKWNQDVADHAWLTTVAADLIVPEFRDGMTSAVTLWTEYAPDQNSQIRYRHLERHELGYVVHALYRGTASSIGKRVPLADLQQTEHLAVDKLKGSSDSDGALVIPTGIPWLTASYALNMPSRQWRRKGDLAFAGRSDYQGILPLFDALDEVWSSWMRDLRLARARLVVPESALEFQGPGKAAQFDLDREIFSGVNSISKPGDGDVFQLVQPDIRVDDHEKTMMALYREILRASGYSPSSWGEGAADGSATMTATEVTDRDKASERTRDKKALYARMAIAQQARAALGIDSQVFPGKGGELLAEAPTVTFPPASQIDPLKNSQTIANLRAAQVITTDTGVRMAHPDWDDERVAKEVSGLLNEGGAPDPTINPADQVDPVQQLKLQADALGVLRRAGVTAEDAARIAGLDGAKFIPGQPITIKDDAAQQ